MPDYTKFNHHASITNSTICENVEFDIGEWLKWSFLQIGAFNNINRNVSGVYGGDLSRLKPVKDPNYSDGKVWQAFRGDWVWESGVPSVISQPVRPSGVWINDSFLATGFYVDYPRGRIVFDNAIAISSKVQTDYAYRLIHVTNSYSPWFKEIQYDSLRADNQQFSQFASGAWAILSQNRIQLPAIIVETPGELSFRGMQLGGGQWQDITVFFHIFSENPTDNKKLLNIITDQNDKTIYLLDRLTIYNNNKLPLNYRGSIASGAMTYEQLISNYMGKKCYIRKMSSPYLYNLPPLYKSIASCVLEVERAEL